MWGRQGAGRRGVEGFVTAPLPVFCLLGLPIRFRLGGFLRAVEQQGERGPVNLFQGGAEEARVITLDEELMDRVRHTEGYSFGCDREDRNPAEPTLKAVGADTVADQIRDARPEGGKVILSSRLLGWGSVGGVQGNGNLGGGVG